MDEAGWWGRKKGQWLRQVPGWGPGRAVETPQQNPLSASAQLLHVSCSWVSPLVTELLTETQAPNNQAAASHRRGKGR